MGNVAFDHSEGYVSRTPMMMRLGIGHGVDAGIRYSSRDWNKGMQKKHARETLAALVDDTASVVALAAAYTIHADAIMRATAGLGFDGLAERMRMARAV